MLCFFEAVWLELLALGRQAAWRPGEIFVGPCRQAAWRHGAVASCDCFHGFAGFAGLRSLFGGRRSG